MRTIRLLTVLALTGAIPLAAQEVNPGGGLKPNNTARRGGALVHYGKWAAAAVAITFTALGAHEHASSNRVFNELLGLCHANSADCAVGAGGAYLNPAAEQLYQTSLGYDRRAQIRLLAGQTGLLFSAALFIIDLRHRASGPDNIPFRPSKLTVEPRADGARVGLRWTF